MVRPLIFLTPDEMKIGRTIYVMVCGNHIQILVIKSQWDAMTALTPNRPMDLRHKLDFSKNIFVDTAMCIYCIDHISMLVAWKYCQIDTNFDVMITKVLITSKLMILYKMDSMHNIGQHAQHRYYLISFLWKTLMCHMHWLDA